MAKSVDKRLYENYLQKADEMLDVAQYAIDGSKNNAAVAASVHCAMNAIDAVAVFYLGRRHIGRHEEALSVIKGAMTEAEFKDLAKQFGGLIALKNQAEYQPDLMTTSQARDAVARASRILSKVKLKLPADDQR